MRIGATLSNQKPVATANNESHPQPFSEAADETYTEHNVFSTQGYLCGHEGIAILGGKPTKVLAQVQKKWNGRGLKAVLLVLDQIKTRQS